MSPLGRFLLSNCDNNFRINLNDHAAKLEQFGNRWRIENYAESIGLTLVSARPTVMGMPVVKAPERLYALVGTPIININ